MNCKPGDLAIIINASPEFSFTLGRIVSVIRRCSKHPDSWIFEFAGSIPKLMPQATNYSSPDDCLKPVSGIPDTEDTDIEQPIKEVA